MVKPVYNRFAAAERAEITLTEDKRQYARGQVKRRLNDSPERVAPAARILALRRLPAAACQHRITAKK
jgi:tRNA/tmRNA/rRNA uracil-C5-methylase (TrmA/RlmC/RlmD family)